MAPEQQPETVVEFGDGDPAPRARRRPSLSGLGLALVRDRRLVPIAAVLGGVALFASLISEWQVTLFDPTDFQASVSGLQPIPTDLVDLGGWAAGYLTGLFLVIGATVIVLFGPPAGRRYARLIGLSAGGLLLGMLAALEPTLDDVSRTLGYAIRYQVSADHVSQSTGRGIWCAIVGVIAVMVALYLAGRHEPVVPVAEPAPAGPAPVWSWRRPGTGADDEQPPNAPFDLEVTSTTPFTSLSDDRDEPTGRDGISR